MQKSRWNKIKNGLSSAGNKIRNNSEQIKKAGETVAGTIFGGGTVENLRQITKDKKKGIKGLAKAGLVIGVMVAVGILAAPLVGPLAAAVFAISAGVATPRIASSFGSKGMQYDSETRQEQRVKAASDIEKIKQRKEELEKSASQKKNIGIGAIGATVLITILTGGASLPLLFIGLAIGAASLNSSSKDSSKAKALEGINEKSTPEQKKDAGLIKQKDLDILKEVQQQAEQAGKGLQAPVDQNALSQSTNLGQSGGQHQGISGGGGGS